MRTAIKMSIKRLAKYVATVVALIAIITLICGKLLLQNGGRFDSIDKWADVVMQQDGTLRRLRLGETSNYYIGVFEGGSNVLFFGCYRRRIFTNESFSESFMLYNTNGGIVDYTFKSYLPYTNSSYRFSRRGLESHTDTVPLGLYVQPDGNETIGEVKFVASAGTKLIDSAALRWAVK